MVTKAEALSLPVRCTFQIEVRADESWNKTTVAIGCDREPPLPAVMAVTEHLMTMFAMSSAAGFEKALELLCDGAKSNRTMMAHGKPIQ